MKLKFKTQTYQSTAVQAVVDWFAGQAPAHGGVRYNQKLMKKTLCAALL